MIKVSQLMGGDGKLTVRRIGTNDVWGWEYQFNDRGGFNVVFDKSPLDTNWLDARTIGIEKFTYGRSVDAAKETGSRPGQTIPLK